MTVVKKFPYDKRGTMYNPKPIEYVETSNGCWECVSHALNKGYPVIRYQNRLYSGNQFSYLMYYGELPEGMVVRHKCDNPRCINPSHLELGTQLDNVQDMLDRNRGVLPPVIKGEENGNSKLTEKEVIEIKTKMLNYKKGMRKQLANEYGVSEATIKAIRSGRL